MEKTAEALTWAADEHFLCAAAAGWWLYCRGRPALEREASNHVLITTVAPTILPHLMKHLFSQERPDRRSVAAHLRGAPFSGSALQAFPSGHALHVGALASAACDLPAPQRALAWTAGASPCPYPDFFVGALGERRSGGSCSLALRSNALSDRSLAMAESA